jgi:hypothetical protein
VLETSCGGVYSVSISLSFIIADKAVERYRLRIWFTLLLVVGSCFGAAWHYQRHAVDQIALFALPLVALFLFGFLNLQLVAWREKVRCGTIVFVVLKNPCAGHRLRASFAFREGQSFAPFAGVLTGGSCRYTRWSCSRVIKRRSLSASVRILCAARGLRADAYLAGEGIQSTTLSTIQRFGLLSFPSIRKSEVSVGLLLLCFRLLLSLLSSSTSSSSASSWPAAALLTMW